MKQRFILRTVLATILLATTALLYAPPPPPPPPAPPDGVPIDGAVFLLLGAGLIYGGRKLYKE
ncbi:MAG: hypothetical protein KA149_03390 [Chitinophagales bacterium]|nr:hypothetical protein [Chitinophagales bacterium]